MGASGAGLACGCTTGDVDELTSDAATQLTHAIRRGLPYDALHACSLRHDRRRLLDLILRTRGQRSTLAVGRARCWCRFVVATGTHGVRGTHAILSQRWRAHFVFVVAALRVADASRGSDGGLVLPIRACRARHEVGAAAEVPTGARFTCAVRGCTRNDTGELARRALRQLRTCAVTGRACLFHHPLQRAASRLGRTYAVTDQRWGKGLILCRLAGVEAVAHAIGRRRGRSEFVLRGTARRKHLTVAIRSRRRRDMFVLHARADSACCAVPVACGGSSDLFPLCGRVTYRQLRAPAVAVLRWRLALVLRAGVACGERAAHAIMIHPSGNGLPFVYVARRPVLSTLAVTCACQCMSLKLVVQAHGGFSALTIVRRCGGLRLPLSL
ncbi:MAG: hypothetical protein CMK50_00080 [Propionibacteriaceae bacterium]|nr:hypothetical protein [Propionibacteriaceae bacterium]